MVLFGIFYPEFCGLYHQKVTKVNSIEAQHQDAVPAEQLFPAQGAKEQDDAGN